VAILTQLQEQLPPYVKAMAAYARIGPPAWAAVTDDRGKLRPRIRDEDFDYLDYQVRCWQDGLPEELRPSKFSKHDNTPESVPDTTSDRPTLFLRYILDLRAKQFKIVILRPLLFSALTVRANAKRVKILARISTDMIDTINEMNIIHDLYRKQQPIINVFLSSAISTLLLIYIHGLRDTTAAVEEQPSSTTIAQEGINKALELICSYSASRSSQRLWKKYSGRNGLLNRLGFTQNVNIPADLSPSVPSSASPSTALVNNENQAQDMGMGMAWANVLPPGYPPMDGLEMLNNGDFQPDMPIDGIPPSTLFDMTQFLVPGDAGFMYNDMW
jgi:hypothetical protein